MIKAKSTKTLPMGPRFAAACLHDFVKIHGSGSVDPASLIGFSWWWAREKGVSGWSKARLKYEAGTLDATPDEIANMQEGKPE